MRTDFLEINNIKYPLRIFVEKRNDIKASIGKRSINIHVPNFISREEMFKEIFKMKSWARQKIIERPERFKLKEKKMYVSGQELKVGDKSYILNIDFKDKESSSARIVGNKVNLCISSNLKEADKIRHASTLLSRCISRKRLPELQKRINALNGNYFNQVIGKIFFKYNKSNWGSCSKKGNINISTRLLFAPDDVLDYICIHELAHLIEHNHSDKFWALVEKAMPNYLEKEKWLKENGDKCEF